MSEKKKKDIQNTEEKEPQTKAQKALTVTGIILCVILVPILIINCVLIVKSLVNKDEVPSIFGLTPLIVNGVSMEPDIKFGDMIIVKDIEAKDVKVGDDIAFFDPSSKTNAVTTHRIKEKIVDDETGKISFKTYGINNNGSDDPKPVTEDKLVGIYNGFRIPYAGKVALFMQTTWGLIICVIVPLILLVGYELLRRKLYDKKKDENVESLKAELEALKAEKAAAEAKPAEEAPTETVGGDVLDAPKEEAAEETAKTPITEKTAEETPDSDKANDNE